MWIELRPDPDRRKTCSGCGAVVADVHDVSERCVRDLPVFRTPTRGSACRAAGWRVRGAGRSWSS